MRANGGIPDDEQPVKTKMSVTDGEDQEYCQTKKRKSGMGRVMGVGGGQLSRVY